MHSFKLFDSPTFQAYIAINYKISLEKKNPESTHKVYIMNLIYGILWRLRKNDDFDKMGVQDYKNREEKPESTHKVYIMNLIYSILWRLRKNDDFATNGSARLQKQLKKVQKETKVHHNHNHIVNIITLSSTGITYKVARKGKLQGMHLFNPMF